VHGQLGDQDRTIDDPVVVLSEDGTFADINLHGGEWVVRSMLDLAGREGFEVVGEASVPLPAEAVDGESLMEREVLCHLPLAKTELAVRILLSQVEAWKEFRRRGGDVRRIEEVLGDQSLNWLLHPPRVAIVGAPNVGKSSLANQLFAQERSITADLPGTTRDWVGEIANLDGLAVMLVDTPGWRETSDVIEREALGRSQEVIREADLVVVVLDATWGLEEGQEPLLAAYPGAVVVVNKCDGRAVWDMDGLEAIHTVATKGVGVEALRKAIRGRFGWGEAEPGRPRWWTERQQEILQRALWEPASLAEL
jgi:small GTP-binding protein